jgi:hypothetical protein
MKMASKPCQVNFNVPIPGSFTKRKRNLGSKMGHTKKTQDFPRVLEENFV